MHNLGFQVGMLAIGYPKINFQAANDNAFSQLLSKIEEILTPLQEASNVAEPESSGQAKNAFQVSSISWSLTSHKDIHCQRKASSSFLSTGAV